MKSLLYFSSLVLLCACSQGQTSETPAPDKPREVLQTDSSNSVDMHGHHGNDSMRASGSERSPDGEGTASPHQGGDASSSPAVDQKGKPLEIKQGKEDEEELKRLKEEKTRPKRDAQRP